MSFFEVNTVLTTGAKYSITCVCSLGDLLFVGCDDGTLRIFSSEGGTFDSSPCVFYP